jgi:hypothetical protein
MGVVVEWNKNKEFYHHTYALVVQHHGFLARYCEIRGVALGVGRGSVVKAGDHIAYVGKMFIDSMLHLEIYSKPHAAGLLTNRKNAPFQRRADLQNPTTFLDRLAHDLPHLKKCHHGRAAIALQCFAVLCLLSCGPSPASVVRSAAAPAPANSAQETAGASPSVRTPQSPAADPSLAGSSQRAQPERAVALLAKRGLWPLGVDEARALLEKFGAVTSKQATPSELSLETGPSGVFRGAEVSYTRSEQQRWIFSAAGFYFGDDALKELHHQLEALLIEHLGKPEWTQAADGEDFSSSGWALTGSLSLLFAPSPNAGEHVFIISISEPEGGAED